jgi:hypothetical protein
MWCWRQKLTSWFDRPTMTFYWWSVYFPCYPEPFRSFWRIPRGHRWRDFVLRSVENAILLCNQYHPYLSTVRHRTYIWLDSHFDRKTGTVAMLSAYFIFLTRTCSYDTVDATEDKMRWIVSERLGDQYLKLLTKQYTRTWHVAALRLVSPYCRYRDILFFIF